jgi:signal transduction histidine kinase
MQDLPSPGRIFGAVEIDTNHERTAAAMAGEHEGEWLQIQPGRDRLHANRAFKQLRDLVRFALDFYASRYRFIALKAIDENREREPPSRKYDRAIDTLDRNSEEIPPAVLREVKKEIVDARKAVSIQEGDLDRRAALLAPLASAGMVALALNHEISRERSIFARIGDRLAHLAKKHSIPELREIADEFITAADRLSSIQGVFSPLLSATDRDAADRLKVREVVRLTAESMAALMPRVEMGDLSEIPVDLRFPVGSLAEWNAVLQNVLSNAWNAMLKSKETKISFYGGRGTTGREWLRISDTGQGLGLPLSDAPRLFDPLERRLKIPDDVRSIAIGGEGLGLAIVRMIANRRGATAAFVEPHLGFSTTFELSWRGEKR